MPVGIGTAPPRERFRRADYNARRTKLLATDAARTLGPYELLEPLGQGGMGIVYRARHRETGDVVALKTVLAPNERILAALRREIHALARVRHPGVVRILEEGLHEGVPWYAMDLCSGITLRQLAIELHAAQSHEAPTNALANAPGAAPWWTAAPRARRADSPSTIPFKRRSIGSAGGLPIVAGGALEDALTVVRRLCAPLAFLHGEGIVHRDLKPENVLVKEGGAPLILDFGLIAFFGGALGRDAIEIGGEVAGTVDYMAPEQARGEQVDARADLYSLGCILYELLTGRVPFVASAPAQVLYQHMMADPTPPSRLVSGVTPDLDRLVLRLLEKDPRARLSYATEVADALERLGARASPQDGGPAAEPYLYRPALHGREDVLKELERHLDLLAKGQGGIVLIEGETGVGRTRVAAETANEAARRRFGVILGEGDPGLSEGRAAEGSGAPLSIFRRLLQALADRCRERGIEEAERLLGRRGKLLALYEPALAALPGQDALPEPSELGPAESRLRLFSYVAETLQELTRDRPVVLVLDDLQWADDLSVGYLAYLARTDRLPCMPLLVLATLRSEEVGGALADLLRLPSVRRLPLLRLRADAVAGIVDDMLGHGVAPADFIDDIVRHTEGNPFYVAEYLRAAVAEGALAHAATRGWSVAEHPFQEDAQAGRTLPIPDTIQRLLARRLERLSPEARRLLGIAAVLGREVDARLLSTLSALDDREILEPLRELGVRQLLTASEAGTLHFVHGKVREVAYHGLKPGERRQAHRAAAEALTALLGDEQGSHLPALAEHWERAEEPARARSCYLSAARHAVTRSALAEAERLYRAHLQLAATVDDDALAARSELAMRVLAPSGRTHLAEAELRGCLAQASDLGDTTARAAVLRGLASCCHALGAMDEARGHYEEARGLYRESGDRRSEALCLIRLGHLQQDQGDMDLAMQLYERASEVFGTIGDRLWEGVALADMATVHDQQGRTDIAERLYQRALSLIRPGGDRQAEARTLGNLAVLEHDRGQLESAEDLYQQALAVARETGHRLLEGQWLENIGMCRHQRGQLREAQELYEQALAIARAACDRRIEASTLESLATLHLDEGRIPEARALAEQALAIHRELRDRRSEGATLRLLSAIHRLGRGASSQASLLIGEAVTLAEGLGDLYRLAECRCEQGLVALAMGEDARARLDEAHRLAASLRAGPESQLGARIGRLERAVQAFEAGQELFRGELPSELPPGLRAWLAQTGQL